MSLVRGSKYQRRLGRHAREGFAHSEVQIASVPRHLNLAHAAGLRLEARGNARGTGDDAPEPAGGPESGRDDHAAGGMDFRFVAQTDLIARRGVGLWANEEIIDGVEHLAVRQSRLRQSDGLA